VNRLAVHLLHWYVLYCGSFFFFFLSNTPFNIYMSKVVLLCILREKYGFFQVLKVCIKKDKKKKELKELKKLPL
jgi:hypothetical protein